MIHHATLKLCNGVPHYSRILPLACLAALSSYSALAQNVDESDEEEIFSLSPFEVKAEENEGYRATSSLAGSRLKTELKDVASAITVVTEEFMQDTASTNLQDLLVYTTNSEVSGIGGNFYGTNAADSGYQRELLINPQNGTRIRGLNQADLTRNYFTSNIPTDSYNTSRIDIQRGSNSILFGLGSPAGIVNGTMKDPYMSESGGAFQVDFDSYGSHREVIDISRSLVEDVLAVRFIALNDEAKYRQDHTFNDDRRVYGTLRWQPKVKDGTFTQFDARIEHGEIDANRPVSTTAADFASNWWKVGQRFMYEPLRSNGAPQDPDLTRYDELRHYFSGAPARDWWNGTPALIYQDPESGAIGNGSLDAYRQRDGSPWGGLSGLSNPNWDEGGSGSWDKNTAAYYSGNAIASALISEYESTTGEAFSGFGSGLWPTQMILSGPLAFIDQTIQGPNKREYNDFDSLELALTQTFLDGDLGFNASLYKETYESGYTNAIQGNRVSIDVNANLRAGYDNPDAGRPFIYAQTGGQDRENEIEVLRATAFYKFRPGEAFNNDLVSKLFGEQTLTAVYTDQRKDNFGASFDLYAWDADSYGVAFNDLQRHNGVLGLHYIGDDLSSYSSFGSIPASAIQGVSALQSVPSSANVLTFDYADTNTWRTGSPSILNYREDKDSLYTDGWQGYDTTESLSLVWQGRLLNDSIIPLFGWREDAYDRFDKPSNLPRDSVYDVVQPFSPAWNFSGVTPISAKEQRTSWGVVVHADRLLDLFGSEMPKGTELSFFYNDSNSFRPADVGVDNYGRELPSPAGETQDYGFRVSLFDKKLEMRTTWYKTTQSNTTLSDASGMIGWSRNGVVRTLSAMAQETWISQRANPTQTTPEWLVNEWFFGEGGFDQGVADTPIPADWRDQLGTLLNEPLRIRSAALPGSAGYVGQGDINPNTDLAYLAPPLTAEEVAYRVAWFGNKTDADWFANLDPVWVEAMQMGRIVSDWRIWGENTPSGQLLTNDLVSEGLEIEITANPSENWRVSFNASKNEATRTNILPDWADFVEASYDLWFDGYDNNPGGISALNYWVADGFADIRHWSGDQSYSSFVDTFGGRMMNNVYAPYQNFLAAEGQGVNELRKWRFNLVTNYQFSEDGPMGGFNVGGAVRWQDKSAIGYYPKFNEEANIWVTDVSRPIYGSSEENVDMWIGYKRTLSDKIDYRVQLNVRNLFADDSLIPIAANPDGSIAQARIPAETTWTLSNTFSF